MGWDLRKMNKTHIVTKAQTMNFLTRNNCLALCGSEIDGNDFYKELCFLTVGEYLTLGNVTENGLSPADREDIIAVMKDNMCPECKAYEKDLPLLYLAELD